MLLPAVANAIFVCASVLDSSNLSTGNRSCGAFMHIEDGVPIPDQHSRYPWKEMRVGQSFFVRTPDDQKVRARVLGSLTSCRCNAQRKLGGGSQFAVSLADIAPGE